MLQFFEGVVQIETRAIWESRGLDVEKESHKIFLGGTFFCGKKKLGKKGFYQGFTKSLRGGQSRECPKNWNWKSYPNFN